MRRLLTALAVAALMLAAACEDSDEPGSGDGTWLETDEADETDEVDATTPGPIDADCEGVLGDEPEFEWLSARLVVDGELGDLCFGVDDQTLVDAWDALAAIAPRGQLADLGLFVGFQPANDDGVEVTLAFVNPLNDDVSQFQMSINLPVANEDADELLLTMAHEFTHAFTATVTQTDRTADAEFDCTTYYNGEACYLEDSIMWAWISEFWGNGLIDEVDPFAEATTESGEDRCSREPGFLGPYAASTPEEDFAEAFAAYVFDVPAETGEVEDKLDWLHAQPGIREFRDRAIAAGMGPLAGNFEVCG
ncbi:MAG: hypothetical protein GY708_03620 [Actinomycetia bacterium]|nr:hypothetical protein [Actinomycetes bacterium]